MEEIIAVSTDNHQLLFFTEIWLAHMLIFTDRGKDQIQIELLQIITLLFLHIK